MITDKKILVTGPSGQIGLPLVQFLAEQNNVWGIARFNEPGSRERLESLGVTTQSVDLSSGDFSKIPDDFDYVIHLAAFKTEGLDYNHALTVNAEGTGLLLQHCQKAKAALIMSTHSVYKPVHDPLHAFAENDPLGDVNYIMSPTYSISKIAEEAVARYCARAYNLPVTIARMNASYGPNGGLPTYHLDWILADNPVITRWDPCRYSLIHQDDINHQVESLLDAASVPATIVNWGGDETPSVHEWCATWANSLDTFQMFASSKLRIACGDLSQMSANGCISPDHAEFLGVKDYVRFLKNEKRTPSSSPRNLLDFSTNR